MDSQAVRNRLLVVVVLLGLVATLGCDPKPRANLLLIGDSNWPPTELVQTTHWVAEQPYLTAVESWTGLGLVNDDAYGDGFARERVRNTAPAFAADYVVTNFGVNDGPAGAAAFEAELDAFLDAVPAGTRVIWITPAAIGPAATEVAAIGDVLVAAQAERPDLWVIPFDAILAAVGGCPALGGAGVVVLPIDACFVDAATNGHLTSHGHLVLATLVRVYVDAAEGGRFREDPMVLANEIISAIQLQDTAPA